MPKRRKHVIGCKGNFLNPIEVPVTRKELIDQWNIFKDYHCKKCFVSFFYQKAGRITEFIYAMRFRNQDLEKGEPIAQLAFIRDDETVMWTEKTSYNYICGYSFDFGKGGLEGYHVPKRCKDDLKYALLPTLYSGLWTSKGVEDRPHPFAFVAKNPKYDLSRFKSESDYKYIPENVWQAISIDPTYYIQYIKRNPLVAEYLGKMGHPEAVRDSRWFKVSKEKFIAMVRYAKKRLPDDRKWSYTNIAYNIKNNSTMSVGEMNTLGKVKNTISWASDKATQNEILHYLKKQRSDLDTYKHYLQMREEQGMSNESHSARFPSNLNAAHARLVMEITQKESAAKDDAMKKAVAGIILISDKYIPLIPKSYADLKAYGKIMDDCLGWEYWVGKIANHESFIFLLGREEEGTAIPYLACEVVQSKTQLTIKQLYRAHNEIASDDEKRYVRKEILPQLTNQLKLMPTRTS